MDYLGDDTSVRLAQLRAELQTAIARARALACEAAQLRSAAHAAREAAGTTRATRPMIAHSSRYTRRS
jgi:hypothetical protein